MINYINKDYEYSNRDKKMLISLVDKNLQQLSKDYINMHLRIMYSDKDSLFKELIKHNSDILSYRHLIDMHYRKCSKNTDPSLKKIFSMSRYDEVGIHKIELPLFPVVMRLDIDSPFFKNTKNVFASIEG